MRKLSRCPAGTEIDTPLPVRLENVCYFGAADYNRAKFLGRTLATMREADFSAKVLWKRAEGGISH